MHNLVLFKNKGIKDKTIMNIFSDLISLLFPEICFSCGDTLFKNEIIICTSCHYKLPKTNFHKSKHHVVSEVFSGRINLNHSGAFLYFGKGGRVQNLIHQFKYRKNKEIGIYLGKLYAIDLQETNWIKDVDLIIPIPLHDSKLRVRGFNQSEEFANGLSQILGLPVCTNYLKRIKKSETQTRKSRYKRWENVSGIFELTIINELNDKHVLLVDDVITTGATIEAAAEELLKATGVKVSVAAMAFTAI